MNSNTVEMGDNYRLIFGRKIYKILNMTERKISVVVDETEAGLVAKINRGSSIKLEVPFGFDATPKIISEKLLELGSVYKYNEGRLLLGDMLMSAADDVPGLGCIYINSHYVSNCIIVWESESVGNMDNNSKNNDDDDDAILEVVRF